MIDNETLNSQRADAATALNKIAAAYATQFDVVSASPQRTENEPIRFLAYVPVAAPDPVVDQRVLDNYEARGEGNTPDEAMEDWECEMKTKPQTGAHLCWRVRPEIEWSKNFDTQKVVWRVYARFAVLP